LEEAKKTEIGGIDMAKKKQSVEERPDDRKHEILVEHCISLYEEFKNSEYRSAKIKEIEEARKIYEQKADKVNFPWDNAYNSILPFETISIDNLEPRLIAGLIGKDPIISFKKGKNDDIDDMIEIWWNDELVNVIHVDKIARNVVHGILLEGTRYSLVKYDKNEITRRDFQFDKEGAIVIGDNGQPIYVELTDPSFEGGKDENIPFNKIFIPDDIGTSEEWEECDKIREVEYTYGELFGKRNDYGYMNIGSWLIPERKKRKKREEEKSPSQLVAGVDISGKETIKCLECHISYSISNLDEEEEGKREEFNEERVIITIALDSKICIRKILQRDVNMNNESLIKRVRLFPEEGRSYGSGIHSKLKSIQDGASTLFNQMINTAFITMIPWYFFEEGAGIKGKQQIMPGKGLKVIDINKIKFPDWRMDPRQYIEFLNIFISLWERLVSISEPQVGKMKTKDTTATEILSVIEEGNIKHNYQTKTFREEFLSIIRTLYDLYYQYMPYEKTIEYKGKEILLPRKEMKRPYNFRLTGSTEKSNKLIERKENEDLHHFLRGDPLANPMTVLEDLLKSYGREDVDRYINPIMGQIGKMYEQFPDQEFWGQIIQQLTKTFQKMQEGEQEAI